MLSAIIGDIAGTRFEYQEFLDRKHKIVNVERRQCVFSFFY